jgi:hypothetical protein
MRYPWMELGIARATGGVVIVRSTAPPVNALGVPLEQAPPGSLVLKSNPRVRIRPLQRERTGTTGLWAPTLVGEDMEQPSRISKERVFQLARLVGLELDGPRAEIIAARLAGVLAELDSVPEESIADVEPLPGFAVEAAPTQPPVR